MAGPLVTLADRARSASASAIAAVELPTRFWHGTRFDRALAGRHAWRCSPTWRSSTCFLLVFNLIPAFPLDGGRIARAIVWKLTGDRTRATRFAAPARPGFAGWGMVGFGVLILVGVIGWDCFSGIWLIFIGIFLGQAARSAEPRRRSRTHRRTCAWPT